MKKLEQGWDGPAIFAAAYAQTLPREAPPKADPIPWSASSTSIPSQPRRRPAARTRGGFRYTKGTNPYFGGRRGTWRDYMIRMVLAHESTWDANRAHQATDEYHDKKLDFSWMLQQNYIAKVQ
jgi:hypothetical protein